MYETHPNAYRSEASEKRNQAQFLISEAEVLEAKANELDPAGAPKPKRAKKEAPAEEPEATPEETPVVDEPVEEPKVEDEKPSKPKSSKK